MKRPTAVLESCYMWRRAVQEMRDEGLLAQHRLIKRMLELEDASIVDPEQPYGVRTYAGFKIQAQAIEAELKRRNLSFAPIEW